MPTRKRYARPVFADRDHIDYMLEDALADSRVVRAGGLDSNFGRALGGIAAAGLIYICSLAVVFAGMWLLFGPTNNQSLSDLFCVGIGVVCLFLVVVFFYMLLAVVPLALVSLTFCLLVTRSLGAQVRWSIVGGFAGGLTGYLGTCWMLSVPPSSVGQWLLNVGLGPVLATLLGQAGGCWPALSPIMIRHLNPASEDSSQAWQWDIRQMLIATAWIAGILALLKGLGALGLGSAGVLFGGLVLQAAVLPLVIRAVTHIRARRTYAAA